LGLGWKVRDHKEGARIKGKDDCTAFLNKLVGKLEDELCADLRRFDRRALLTALLLSCRG
jgi:hypothetical protein